MKILRKSPFFLALCCALSLPACDSQIFEPPKVATEVKQTVRLTLVPQRRLQRGKEVDVYAKLTSNEGLYILNENDLKTVHGEKFHLLVVDPTLTDYQHIHPVPTATPGLYHFTFTPKLTGGYRAWANITPVATGIQEHPYTDMGNPQGINIAKTEKYDVWAGGYHFRLSFDKEPVSGEASVGTITITDASGRPVTALEPIMGAYGHIVGFQDDFRTIVHIHPMGREPNDKGDRGGPTLTFHLEPERAGFIKLFAQVRMAGKDVFVPFGVNVRGNKG